MTMEVRVATSVHVMDERSPHESLSTRYLTSSSWGLYPRASSLQVGKHRVTSTYMCRENLVAFCRRGKSK